MTLLFLRVIFNVNKLVHQFCFEVKFLAPRVITLQGPGGILHMDRIKLRSRATLLSAEA